MLALAVLLALQDSPVELPLPAGIDRTRPFTVVRADTGKEVPCQVDGDSLFLLAPRGAAAFKIVPGTPSASPKVEWADDGGALVATVGDKKIFRYHRDEVKQPDPLFSRSGYLHPIWTPAGSVVTNDSPPNHLHHHGIWSAWTSSEFEGRKSNFWESKEKQGKVEFVKLGDSMAGPVFGRLKVHHRFLNLNAPDGPKVALNEVWDLRVYALTDRFIFDLTSTQTAATDQPLVIKEYRYGGIGFRGSADWEGKDGVRFLTSEGKGRVDGHATKARWCCATGRVNDRLASVGFLCHPSDFRYPQPMRIHPDEPFFNWAVPQGGDFAIEPGKPYVARYRFIVADIALNSDAMNFEWTAYAEPPKISLEVSK
jgi:hypothetical protein